MPRLQPRSDLNIPIDALQCDRPIAVAEFQLGKLGRFPMLHYSNSLQDRLQNAVWYKQKRDTEVQTVGEVGWLLLPGIRYFV